MRLQHSQPSYLADLDLRHNNKPLDLSRTIRLSGLSSGAKLELVQLSKSAGVVSVALQLPESEAQGVPNGRLTDKFPSTTTLWLVLRKFESIAPGSKNLTAKGAPSTGTGAGRLYYQQPVIQIMGRELASFTDLQKSLAQLGFNSGSTLLRLSFRLTETPLEEAMVEIQGYFDSVSTQAPPAQTQQGPPPTDLMASGNTTGLENTSVGSQPAEQTDSAPTTEPTIVPTVISSTSESQVPTQLRSGDRPVSVFAPPTGSTPSAALTSYRDSDYTPTVEHAQIHQKLLQQSSLNKRLPTDAELAAQAASEQEKWDAVQDVEVKIRFPDQSAVSAKFGRDDTSATLYSFARSCLEERFQTEAFLLRNPGIRGKGEIIPDDDKKLLIRHLKFKGRILVVFGWDDQKASMAARSARQVLKIGLRSQAQALTAPEIPSLDASEEEKGIKVNVGKGDEGAEGSGDGKKKMPKWLKGLGGKK